MTPHPEALSLAEKLERDAPCNALNDEAAAMIRRLLGEVDRVEYAVPKGLTLKKMRAAIRAHPLYGRGDTVLIWVNESDLCGGPLVPFRLPPAPTDNEGCDA